jgi:nitroimidazol reductase NimA-like FMN-containing flavoprotein (pyridoxamine 5'-phosphate oxidase superfamily)
MRKKDKEIRNIAALEEILSKAMVCRLGLCEGNQPYVVPLCFGYEDNALYFHCASQGKKLDIIRRNNNVCFEVDIDHQLIKADQACNWGMKYKSVIGFGKAVFIKDIELKRKALDIIMQQFSKDSFKISEEAVKNTTVVKIEIASMTGKKSD